MKSIFLKVSICLATLFTNFNSFGQEERIKEVKSLKRSVSFVCGPKLTLLPPHTINTLDGNSYTNNISNSRFILGLNFHQQLSSKFIIGLDLFYYSLISRGTIAYQASGILKNASENRSKLRVMATFSRTIDTKNPNLEMYIGGAIGFNQSLGSFYVDNIKQPETAKPSRAPSLPICMRMYYGMRYTIYKNFGLTGEFGLGGPLVTAGLSYKF